MCLKNYEIMDSKIVSTIKQWLPWSIESEQTPTEYSLLKNLGNYCRQRIEEGSEDKAVRVIKVINILYSSGALHEKNAIENEFLEVLATAQAPASLKTQMKLLPEDLKKAYLKTILEN
jgi:hypothetical protein